MKKAIQSITTDKYFPVVIKLCADPHCDAIYHNIPKKITKCNDCGGSLIEINEKTYFSKFHRYFFQYNYEDIANGIFKYWRPEKIEYQLQLSFEP